MVHLTGKMALAGQWERPSSELVQGLAPKLGRPAAVAVSIRNASSLSSSEVQAVRSELEGQLRTRGYRIVESSQTTPSVTLILSENVQGYVWLAQVGQMAGQRGDVVVLNVPRGKLANDHGSSSLVLRKRLLLSLDEQILDLTLTPDPNNTDSPGTMATVLTRSRVTVYRVQSPEWQEVQAAVLQIVRPLPRDARGMIVRGGAGELEVRLPGMKCTVAASSSKADCVQMDDPWPLAQGDTAVDAFFSSSRNFFTGAIGTPSGSGSVPAFYSAAMLSDSKWLFATTEGMIVQTDFVNARTLAVDDWGSNLAQLRNNCGGETVLLAAGDGDYTRPDQLLGFHVIERGTMPVTTPVDLPGPVTALWSHGEWVLAVVHNLSTEKYEAYSTSLLCNQ